MLVLFDSPTWKRVLSTTVSSEKKTEAGLRGRSISEVTLDGELQTQLQKAIMQPRTS